MRVARWIALGVVVGATAACAAQWLGWSAG